MSVIQVLTTTNRLNTFLGLSIRIPEKKNNVAKMLSTSEDNEENALNGNEEKSHSKKIEENFKDLEKRIKELEKKSPKKYPEVKFLTNKDRKRILVSIQVNPLIGTKYAVPYCSN